MSIMDKYLIANINMFSLNNQVFLVNDFTREPYQIGAYSLADLPQALVQIAYDNDINIIKIAGNNKYSEKISDEIAVQENLLFRVTMSIASYINHKVPPVYSLIIIADRAIQHHKQGASVNALLPCDCL